MNIFSKILKYINNYKFYFIFISLSFLTYIVGFFLRENSAGGGKIDLVYEWNNHLLLRDNLLNFIYYPLIYDGARIPLYQILSILINPFTDNILSYVNYFFLYSFLIPLLFFLCIKKKYKDFSLHQLLLLTSVIFFSPYFRTSSYWGLEENYAIIFSLVSTSGFNPRDWVVNKIFPFSSMAIQSALEDPLSTINLIELYFS
jgi:hypothetical protein